MIVIAKRSLGVYITVFLCFLLIFARLCSIATGRELHAAAISSGVRIFIADSRGDIVDCDGQPLVNEQYEYIAAVPPTAAAIKAVSHYCTAAQLQQLHEGKPVAVTVDEHFNANGVRVFRQPIRYQNSTAAHIIGYLDSLRDGAYGIERGYNELLRGGELSVTFRQDAHGRVLGGMQPTVHSPAPTGHVMLTLRRELQLVVQTAAARQIKSGAVVVVENATGQLLACCSLPQFSAGELSAFLEMSDSPFVNKAFEAYSCGSVFKLVTAAAALERAHSPTVVCNGGITVGSVHIGCLGQHGALNMKQALALSCNSYYISLGQSLGSATLHKTAQLLGFGRRSDLCSDIRSAAGRLPSESKLARLPAELANLSFGQGELATTPLQIAMLLQCIANDGRLLQPSLVKQLYYPDGSIEQPEVPPPTLALSPETARTLCEYLISAVEEGTGRAAKPSRGIAGGKTATAQTGRYNSDGSEQVTAWFAGFCGRSSPDYTIVVMAEKGVSGSVSCAPVFREIAEYLNLL